MIADATTCTAESHAAIKLDPAKWATLAHVGFQSFEADETGPAGKLDLRNCSCGSTLCVEVAP